MQSLCGADEPRSGNSQMAHEEREASAMNRRMYNNVATSDNARAHYGDQYQQTFTGSIHQIVGSTLPLSQSPPERTISEALRFEGMDARRTAIKVTHGNTCEWFFASPEYIKWRDNSTLSEHHGFLWVRGKPGAGKSTLMRLAVEHADQKFPHDIRMSFFFDAKGSTLQRSVEGMFRSLLYQLLEQCPGLDRTIKQRAWKQSDWPVELLEGHFRGCVLLLRGKDLTCHIDALDECEEFEVRAMIEFFEDLGRRAESSHVRLRVCFAGRDYPYISMSKCVQVVLDGHKGHLKDIEMYVRDNLKIADTTLRDDLTLRIYLKAHGVFLYAAYATRLTNESSDRGHSQSLDAQLDVIPAALTLLYKDAIFERGPGDNRYLLPMLLWIAFAQRPLSTNELYHAVMYTSDGKAGAALIDNMPNASQIERSILNTTKGLAEISPYNDKHVSFINDTVRQYLEDSGIGRLDSSKTDNPIGFSHELLKTNCHEYILLAGRALSELKSFKYVSERNLRFYTMFPLLRYVLPRVVTHAELAQAHGVSQSSFVEAFPLDLVLVLSKLICKVDWKCDDSYSPTATKTYMFALSGAPNLLQLELERITARNGSRANSDPTAVRGDPAHSSDQGQWGHPLHAAISIHDYDCVKVLLEHNFDPNARGRYSTALESAIRNHWNDMSIIKLLLDEGANVNGRREYKKDDEATVLHVAIGDGSVEAVRILVEHGADIHTRLADGLTALEYAMERCTSRDPIVAYLFERELQDAAPGASSPWSLVDQ